MKTHVLHNMPIYLGMCIFEVSKTTMYEFYYDYIKPKFGDTAKLLRTDTDSLIYEIKTDDFYADSKDDVESRFDTSEYPKDHPATAVCFKVGANMKVVGIMKDESAGNEIVKFAGLRAKCHAFKVERSDDELNKMNVDFTSAETTYTRPM
jgi:hypothetical protein